MERTFQMPEITTIKMGNGGERLTVRVYCDGAVSLEMTTERASFCIDMPSQAAGELIAALTPEKSALIETLDHLCVAAEGHCPSPLTDDPEVVAGARDLRDAIGDARALLGVHAS